MRSWFPPFAECAKNGGTRCWVLPARSKAGPPAPPAGQTKLRTESANKYILDECHKGRIDFSCFGNAGTDGTFTVVPLFYLAFELIAIGEQIEALQPD
jgi:hypothetical protein